jgi:hypothetical protein
VSDEGLDHEFSRGMAVDLGPKQPGDTVEFSGPELTVEGPYALTVHTPPQVEAPAAFTVVYDGQEIGQTPASYGKSDMAPLGAAVFPVGRPKLTLRFTAPGRAVVDCFQFGAARQLQHVREAETAKVLACEGPEPARDMGVLWSGGRHLRFPAAKPGDAIELEVTIPPGGWSLCVGLTRGPEYGNWEATLDAGAGVVLRAFAPRLEVRDWQKIGRLQGKNGPTRVRFVCVGKDPQATGSALGLDYLGWQPVVVADAIEGETAEIVDVKDGHITDQLLGPRFSGGNHLWFHPRKAGASFTWLVHVATAGPHVLSVYFTKSWDYAVVRVSLDGRALGEFDTYDPVVTWGGETKLGSVDLERGQHRLTFEVVGRNDKSKGILVGVDCITLVPTRN